MCNVCAKITEPFIICDGSSKIGSDMSSNSTLDKEYGAGKTKTPQIVKDKRNKFWL